jgi:hypothetical protein
MQDPKTDPHRKAMPVCVVAGLTNANGVRPAVYATHLDQAAPAQSNRSLCI